MKELKHLAIIMDGNRRWAKKKLLPGTMGHKEGAENYKRIARVVIERQIPYFTVWALSTENVKKRSTEELNYLFSLIEELPKHIQELFEKNARLNIIGDLSVIPEKTRTILEESATQTKTNTGTVLTIAINYGGRDELIRATKTLIRSGKNIGEINESMINQTLDTADLPDVDLIIRSGGQQRLSGFMPWQSVYAELYFTDICWPDFSEKELDKAIERYREQDRRFGK